MLLSKANSFYIEMKYERDYGVFNVLTFLLVLFFILTQIPRNSSLETAMVKGHVAVLDKCIEQVSQKLLLHAGLQCTLIFNSDSYYYPHAQQVLEELLNLENNNNYIMVNLLLETLENNIVVKSKFLEHCSIVVYFRSQLSISVNWVKNLPGSYYNSFHVMLRPQGSRTHFAPPKCLIYLVNIYSYNYGEVLEFLIETGNTPKNYPVYVGKFTYPATVTFYQDFGSFFPDLWTNFQKYPLVFGIDDGGPTQSMIDYSIENKDSHRDTSSEILIELSKTLNGTIKIHRTVAENAAVLGSKDPISGIWDGVIGELVAGRAHLTHYVALTDELVQDLSFSQVFYNDPVVFITATAKVDSSLTSLFAIWKCFKPLVWAMLFVSIIASLITSAIFEFFNYNLYEGRYLNPVKHFSIFLRPIIDQCIDSKVPNELKLRVLVLTWWLSLIISITLLKSGMISALTNTNMVYPPKTFEELINSPYKAMLFDLDKINSSLSKLSNITLIQNVLKISFQSQSIQSFSRIIDEPLVVVGPSSTLNSIASMSLADDKMLKKWLTSHDSILSIYGAVGYSKDFPHIKETVNRRLEAIKESGLIWHWRFNDDTISITTGKYFRANYGLPNIMYDRRDSFEKIKITFNGYISMILVLFAGLIVASVVFVIEKCKLNGNVIHVL